MKFVNYFRKNVSDIKDLVKIERWFRAGMRYKQFINRVKLANQDKPLKLLAARIFKLKTNKYRRYLRRKYKRIELEKKLGKVFTKWPVITEADRRKNKRDIKRVQRIEKKTKFNKKPLLKVLKILE